MPRPLHQGLGGLHEQCVLDKQHVLPGHECAHRDRKGVQNGKRGAVLSVDTPHTIHTGTTFDCNSSLILGCEMRTFSRELNFVWKDQKIQKIQGIFAGDILSRLLSRYFVKIFQDAGKFYKIFHAGSLIF